MSRGAMRITGGTLRGRAVACPPGVIRPAMDRMRESLFAILGPLDGCSFLDLFSGSALVGLEAYSRGAWPVALVEKDRGKRAVIEANLHDLQPRPRLYMEPVERFVARAKERFSVIYLDPPFDYQFKHDLLARLATSGLLGADSRVIIHAPAAERFDDPPPPLQMTDHRSYGNSQLWFFGCDAPG